MRLRIASYLWVFLAGFALAAGSASAQTVAYRQTNLASDVNVPGFANHTNLSMQNPWGIAFLPGQSFVLANTDNGRVTTHDAAGASAGPGGFIVPNSAGTGQGSPTGIVADPNSFFGGRNLRTPFVMVAGDGAVLEWGPDANGNVLPQATLVLDNSSKGAVYRGVAILTPACCAPFLAVTNFHSGLVEPYTAFFVTLAPPGSFTDPNLPAGYAPFGIQVIGNQVFVTYAVQDAAKHDPVIGLGNGIVNIFDLQGNFVRRFTTAGNLNAPWGVTQASANFGPFSNDILIGNAGDGIINAFDPVTGNFAGQIKNGDGNVVVNSGLHALIFRSDGFGDPNTLYFTAGINNGQDGLFGAITAGLVSTARVSVPTTPIDTPAPITVTVSAGPGNTGTPTGQVAVRDGGVPIADISLINGMIVFPEAFTKAGTHVIEAQYGGDVTFLPSSSQLEVEVTGLTTMVTLTAPPNAAPGSVLTLTATANSTGGIPTGQIVFQDGNTSLGTAPLDSAGIATLRINTLASGAHSLTASYPGDGKFDGSTSASVTITIANPDFSLGASPATAAVMAGQSTQFMLTVTPAGGFTNNVTFSCSPVIGITCTFNPVTVTPANGAASTTLTVTTSASVSRYGVLLIELIEPGSLLAALVLFSLVVCRGRRLQGARASLLTTTALLALVGLSLTVGGCGGYGNMKSNRGTASINIMAQSGAISHSTTVSVTVQ